MILELQRFGFGKDSTVGLLHVGGDFQCFTLEDERRVKKVAGETAIPTGTYKIKLRDAGGMAGRYRLRFPWHRGMLHLQEVPDFEWIYIHIGNDDDDTRGCILVGDGIKKVGSEYVIHDSTKAYIELTRKIYQAIDSGEEVMIHVSQL